MQLEYLIRELIRLKNLLPPESEIRIGEVHGYGNHTYELNDIGFTPVDQHIEPEHTCDSECECEPMDDGDGGLGSPRGCPVCDCEGCCQDEPTPITIYFLMGDQDPYSLPETIDEDELKVRLGDV